MIFRQLFDYDTYTYTYLIASNIGRQAVLIDPVKSQHDSYIKLIKELGLTLVYAMDTHVHADHVTALGDLRESTQCETIMGKQSKASCVSHKVTDGQKIEFDGLFITPIYTPGHTDDSYSFVMNDRIFTGDTLLIRGTGRTDFQHGNSHDQYNSLFNKILTLPETMLVYPGHDYNGMTVSTIGEEKQFNPRLQVSSPDEYAELMGKLNLPNPKFMDVAIPANLQCGKDKT